MCIRDSVHIMLTVRPLKENGAWGAKCRKAYDLDENGQRIPDGKGGWKNHREDTTDWNDKGNVEIWRAAWAAYTLSLIHIYLSNKRSSYQPSNIPAIPDFDWNCLGRCAVDFIMVQLSEM